MSDDVFTLAVEHFWNLVLLHSHLFWFRHGNRFLFSSFSGASCYPSSYLSLVGHSSFSHLEPL